MARRPVRSRRTAEPGEGQIWAPIAVLLTGILCVIVFVAALPRDADEPAPAVPDVSTPTEQVAGPSLLSAQWNDTLATLCQDPALQADGIALDCETGTITFGDALFDTAATVQLTEEGIRKLHEAVASMLRSLRTHDEVWRQIESIEVRGHADPRALRDPYLTNMRISQERPMAIMFYLIADWGLSERDRHDLEQLMILSAASHSRPPSTCPEPTSECFPFWRRVEITPRLRVPVIAGEMLRSTTGLELPAPEES
jgi:outer membrane protein OmpA-like peptidoglycan-associated protein